MLHIKNLTSVSFSMETEMISECSKLFTEKKARFW